MPYDANKQLDKLRQAICNPDIHSFLDKPSMIQSRKFRALFERCIEHYHQYNNHDLALKVINIFSRTKHYRPLLEYFCARTGCRYSITQEQRVRLKRSPKATIDDRADFNLFMSRGDIRGSLAEVRRLKPPPKAKIRKGSKGYSDAMLRRVPGSFESNQR